jgi:hypothetical protein
LSKAGAYLSEATLRCSALVLLINIRIGRDKTIKDKDFSLFEPLIISVVNFIAFAKMAAQKRDS